MVELQPAISIVQVDEESIPPEVTIAEAPTSTQEAISFELVPLPEEIISKELPPPTEPFQAPPTLAPILEPEVRIIEKIIDEPPQLPPKPTELPPDVEKEEVKAFVPIPVDLSKIEYTRVVWAESLAHAQDLAVMKYGGKKEDYIVDLYAKGPRPYFVFRHHVNTEGEKVFSPLSLSPSKLTIPEAKEEQKKVLKCSVCLSEFDVSLSANQGICPTCGALVKDENS